MSKKRKKIIIVNIAIPVNSRVRKKKFEKSRKTSGFEVGDYRNLEFEKFACSIVCCRGSLMCY